MPAFRLECFSEFPLSKSFITLATGGDSRDGSRGGDELHVAEAGHRAQGDLRDVRVREEGPDENFGPGPGGQVPRDTTVRRRPTSSDQI